MKLVSFTVPGLPAPWTSPRRGRGGGSMPTPASERMKAWKVKIQLAATTAMRSRAKLGGPVGLILSFSMDGDTMGLTVIAEQMKDEPGMKFHVKKPDLTNLIKCSEDALSGIVFKDDCVVASSYAHKFTEEPCPKPRRSRKERA